MELEVSFFLKLKWGSDEVMEPHAMFPTYPHIATAR